jgi:molybdopterin synthase catalytic subunit
LITEQPIRVEDYVAPGPDAGGGAVVLFTGVVRADEKDGRRVICIHYDCYKDMAQKEITNIVDRVRETSGVSSIRVVHRVGDVSVGEVAMLVVVTAGHRDEAFAANRLVVDEIKKRVPIWKKEIYDDSSSKWL